MDLGSLVFVVVIGVLLVISFVHFTGGSQGSDARDPGLAIMEYQRAFPDEAIRDACMTADGQASFFRLASGKTGFLKAMGRHYICRLIEPGTVSVRPLNGRPGLHVDFHETSLAAGDYVFKKEQEAADVAQWLLDGFAASARAEQGTVTKGPGRA